MPIQLEVLEPRRLFVINGIPTDDFPAVGVVGQTTAGLVYESGSGSLIAPRFVLTAAHLTSDIDDTAGTFRLGNETFHTRKIFVHPDYDRDYLGDDRAHDIAILQLTKPVGGVAPLPLFRDTPEVGDLLTMVGYGDGGTAAAGSDGRFGTKRMGATPIDRVTNRLIRWDFDNASESNTAAGDSGSPGLLTIDGIDYLAGITSGGELPNASLGDSSYDTRVDVYADWIDQMIANASRPTVSISASGDVGETSQPATITVSLAAPFETDVTVALSFSGTAIEGIDIHPLPSTVTIPAEQISATFMVTPIDDTEDEGDETFSLTVVSRDTYNIDTPVVELTIADDDHVTPVVSITSRDSLAAESFRGGEVATISRFTPRHVLAANGAQFTIHRTGSLARPLTVQYAITGTATVGSDYNHLSGTVTLPGGRSSVTLPVLPVNDRFVEGTETVVLTLTTDTEYLIDDSSTSVTLTLADNDQPDGTNDFFESAQIITGTSVIVTADNTLASPEPLEPDNAGVAGGKTLWWRWTAPASGPITISTRGSTFDTTLGVYTGESLRILSRIADNDDEDEFLVIVTSQLTFNAIAEETYFVLVDGYDGAIGRIRLSLNGKP